MNLSTHYPVFLSVVLLVRNASNTLDTMLRKVVEQVSALVSDYEIIVVDNASRDESVGVLQKLTGFDGLPNLQIYCLTKPVNHETQAWVGLENALGDFVVVLDPFLDSVDFIPAMLDSAMKGNDVVFASNEQKPRQRLLYKMADQSFNWLYKKMQGVNLTNDAPSFRLVNKKVINFILQHPNPSVGYKYLPATGGFLITNLTYSSPVIKSTPKSLVEGVDKGVQLLVSTTHLPMRLVTGLSLFGAVANLIYSIYVVLVGFIKEDVAPGWLSLSLQQSGMFFLISLVLLVLGEYILNMAAATHGGPLYHVGQEFTSVKITRKEKLNIEVVDKPDTSVSSHNQISSAS